VYGKGFGRISIFFILGSVPAIFIMVAGKPKFNSILIANAIVVLQSVF
jgi:hypothetical protein